MSHDARERRGVFFWILKRSNNYGNFVYPGIWIFYFWMGRDIDLDINMYIQLPQISLMKNSQSLLKLASNVLNFFLNFEKLELLTFRFTRYNFFFSKRNEISIWIFVCICTHLLPTWEKIYFQNCMTIASASWNFYFLCWIMFSSESRCIYLYTSVVLLVRFALKGNYAWASTSVCRYVITLHTPIHYEIRSRQMAICTACIGTPAYLLLDFTLDGSTISP